LIGLVIAALFAAAYWFTLAVRINPDGSLASVGTTQSDSVLSDKELTDIDQLRPATLMREGKPEEAVKDARLRLQQDPLDVRNLICAGNILSAVAPYQDEGFELLQRAKYLAPQSRWVRLDLARKLAEAKRYNQSIEEYKGLSSISGTEEWTTPKYELAQIYIKKKDFENAENVLKSTRSLDVDNSRGQKQFGFVLGLNGDEEEGFAEFKRAVAREQEQSNAAVTPAETSDGDATKNQEENGKAHTAKTDNSEGDLLKAIDDVRESIKAKPDDLSLKLQEARLLLVSRQTDQANKAFNALLEKNKDNPEVHLLDAEILLWSKDPLKAKQEFDAAVKLAHDAPA
jgi:tetratricopeptide (TPR) repeat protein